MIVVAVMLDLIIWYLLFLLMLGFWVCNGGYLFVVFRCFDGDFGFVLYLYIAFGLFVLCVCFCLLKCWFTTLVVCSLVFDLLFVGILFLSCFSVICVFCSGNSVVKLILFYFCVVDVFDVFSLLRSIVFCGASCLIGFWFTVGYYVVCLCLWV